MPPNARGMLLGQTVVTGTRLCTYKQSYARRFCNQKSNTRFVLVNMQKHKEETGALRRINF
jgi:hypothetical protein